MIEQLDLLREDYGTATLVVWGAFFIGVLFGVIAEFSRYCARAALAEWAPGDERSAGAANGHPRSKQYLTAVLVALAGTQLLFVSQNIDLAQSIGTESGAGRECITRSRRVRECGRSAEPRIATAWAR